MLLEAPRASRWRRRALRLALLLAACGATADTACGGTQPEELPAEFAMRVNPSAGDAVAARRGRELFVDHCAPCHGESADGHGPASVGLRPSPADLVGPAVVPAHSDAYLFYRVTVGKRDSAMPSFQHSLSESERWEIVAYLRSLAASAGKAAGPRAAAGG